MDSGLSSFAGAAYFVQHTLAQITCVFAVVIALLQLGLYVNNRNDTQYGWTFVAVAGYATFSLSSFMPVLPHAWQLVWLLVLYCGVQACAMGGCIYFLNECGVSHTAYSRIAGAWGGLFLAAYGGYAAWAGAADPRSGPRPPMRDRSPATGSATHPPTR